MAAIDPQRIQESLVRENQELRARARKLEETLNQRAVDTVGEFLDGLGYLLRAARAGGKQEGALLRLLVQQLGESTVLARIQLPGSENGAEAREYPGSVSGDSGQ